MNALSKVYIFKILATIVVWCVPLLLFPSSWLIRHVGLVLPSDGNENDDDDDMATAKSSSYTPSNEVTIMVLRLLGWAYLALCVGYGFGLYSSIKYHRIEIAPVVVGIVSNGGACLWLIKFATFATALVSTSSSTSSPSSVFWSEYHVGIRFILQSSIIATALITFGLYVFGWCRYWAGITSATAIERASSEQQQVAATGKNTTAETTKPRTLETPPPESSSTKLIL